MKNANLHKAKKSKNDEFYTRYEDIEKELQYYKDELLGKTIYCNCDDYRDSNFPRYFKDNFKSLGLKKVISTNYDIGDGSWLWEYDGNEEKIQTLAGDGDFRSPECIEFLKQADVVVTNPPFSLFREYIAQLMAFGKKFLIIGNGNAVTCKEIFPWFKDNKVWLGASKGMGGKAMEFMVSKEKFDSSKGTVNREENGICYVGVMMCTWFTNVDHKKRHDKLDLCKKYNSTDYPKYDNYDAIEVSRVENIPEDYDGIMGVPISFLDKYCPSQFEVVGITENAEYLKPLYVDGCDKYDRPYLNGDRMYSRLLIKRKS